MPRYKLTIPADFPRKHLTVLSQTIKAPDEEMARLIATRGAGSEGKEVWLSSAKVEILDDLA